MGIMMLGDPCVDEMLFEKSCKDRGLRVTADGGSRAGMRQYLREVWGRFFLDHTLPMTVVLIFMVVVPVVYMLLPKVYWVPALPSPLSAKRV